MLPNIETRYFDWMARLVFDDDDVRDSYIPLLNRLNELNFYFTIPMDKNRYHDGLSLRGRFAYECDITQEEVMDAMYTKPCSVLEMMIALALKCEENIASDPDYGNRITIWFMEMLHSLKLDKCTIYNFDEKWVDFRIEIWLSHEYEPDGEGGLFTIHGIDRDMRDVEIWYQMCWYLNTVL